MTTPPDAVAVVAVLRERGWSLAVAESLTGGLLTARIVDVPGASAVLRGGVVAYDTALKHTLLGVDAARLARTGPVDPVVAEQMADGVRRAAVVDGVPATVGLATTGVAGPEPQDGRPVGEVHVGVSLDGAVTHRSLLLTGDRAHIRSQAVDAALEMLADALG